MTASPTVFFSHSTKTNRETTNLLTEALKSNGYEVFLDAANIQAGDAFPQSIRQMIERSDFIIADLTGNNPNVYYELGFAQALGKLVLPIVQESEGHVSPHIAGTLYIPYNPQQPDSMIDYVLSWMKRRQPAFQQVGT